MRNLRTQLMTSHFILALMMLTVMIGGVINVFHLGRSIDRILKNNYKSVIAAQNMKETLERQDSAATFFLAGQQARARKQYEQYWPLFVKAFDIESHNITEPGERHLVDMIRLQFRQYTTDIRGLLYASPPLSVEQARTRYFGVLEQEFIAIKQSAQSILDLNQAAIVRADEQARSEAKKASWAGIIATTIAFLAAIIFALRMIRIALEPILMLIRQAEEIGMGHLNQRIDLNRTDEVGALAESFNDMAQKLRQARSFEEERLHRAERMSDAAIDSLYDPVIVTDSTGHVVHLNHAAEGLFGPAVYATGITVQSVTQDERIARAVDRATKQQSASAADDEEGFITLQTANTQRIYRLKAAPMRDDGDVLLGAVAVLEDVTHLKELDRLKTEFIGVASHELRTPVTSLLLSVGLLEEGAAGVLTEDQKQIVQAQKEDLDRLDKMMKELLEITRLESGVTPPHFELISPEEPALAALRSVSASAEAKQLILRSQFDEVQTKIRADLAQITRALVNLLNNAIQHTPSDGTIELCLEQDNDKIIYRVRDNGKGIPEEFLSRIFERFVQVPGATRSGSGLGLSIAQTIARAHQGDISVESEEGKGSEFSLVLPSIIERKDSGNGADTDN
jgi:PAS domain S-box-containing protein